MFFLYCYLSIRYLHSFPTRRSSDLFVSKEKYLEEKAAKVQVQKELIAAYGQTELLLKQQMNQQRKRKKKLTLYQRFKKTKLGRMAVKLKKMLWKRRSRDDRI